MPSFRTGDVHRQANQAQRGAPGSCRCSLALSALSMAASLAMEPQGKYVTSTCPAFGTLPRKPCSSTDGRCA